MQAITHFWISKTNTLNSHKRPELFFSTIAELQPMRILDFNTAAEKKLSYVALRTDGIYPPLIKHKLLSLRTYSSHNPRNTTLRIF